MATASAASWRRTTSRCCAPATDRSSLPRLRSAGHLEALAGPRPPQDRPGSLSHARRRGLRPGQLPARGRAQQRHARRRAGHSDAWTAKAPACASGISPATPAAATRPCGRPPPRSPRRGWSEVDAVVLATSTGDFGCPATAPRVAARLGLVARRVRPGSAACTGFVYGLASVGSLISAGLADSALLVGVDTFSHTPHPADRSTRALVRRRRRSGVVLVCRRCRGRRRAAGLDPAATATVRPADDPRRESRRTQFRTGLNYWMDGGMFGQGWCGESDWRRRSTGSLASFDLHHLVPHQANTHSRGGRRPALTFPSSE
ncbi:hypothetical protein ACPA9J_31450 [Pseudomonas aeruginosa]